MKKQFNQPGVMKVAKRTYATGAKKLKNIKMFEEYSQVNEAWEEAVANRKINISKEFKDQVTTMVEMSKKFAEMDAEVKKYGKLLGAQESSIQKTMEDLGAVFVEIDTAVGKVSLEMKNKAGKVTKSYQQISEALEELLPKTEEVISQTKTIVDKFTKHNPDKTELEYKVHEGAISDAFKAIADWVKSAFNKLKGLLPSFSKSADKLSAAVADISK